MEPARHRPKLFPPPEFPPRKKAVFSRMPPAVFPAILGFVGLGLALRRGLSSHGFDATPADLLLAMASALWAFASFAYLVKLSRRAGVLAEDLRVLPGRNGLAAATMGGMAVAAALVPVAPHAAAILLVVSLLVHTALTVFSALMACRLSPEARPVDPGWHLRFVGFIVGAIAAIGLGWAALANALLWLTIPLAVAIWAASAHQFRHAAPPAPLRPLLAIHLSPAALFATVAAMLGHDGVATGFLALGTLLLLALLASARWITAAGFTPLWGAFTFPLAAYASALFANGLIWAGTALFLAGAVIIPAILWKTLTLWAAGSLAAKTNAAEA